jgi:hypothetical protein
LAPGYFVLRLQLPLSFPDFLETCPDPGSRLAETPGLGRFGLGLF